MSKNDQRKRDKKRKEGNKFYRDQIRHKNKGMNREKFRVRAKERCPTRVHLGMWK